MIPERVRDTISERLVNEIGFREDVGKFVFIFAALQTNRDVEYALEELGESDDPIYKKAISIVLEGVS